jgi:uncharacterized cofD-like protein
MPSTTPISPRSAKIRNTGHSSTERRVDVALTTIGGGTGLGNLLRGLKHHVGQEISELTAVVAVTDDGGSSGRLRRDFGVLPPGDIRSCIVALADDEDLLARLFEYRFDNSEGLSGHSFGNLFLAALNGITGDFYQAILTAESVLSVRGRILPATLTDVHLKARGKSGRAYEGESAIGESGEPLRDLSLEPADPPAFPPAVGAIQDADLVLLGPGSLYTSIMTNLLIPGIASAVHSSRGRIVLPLNLMTQPGETDGLDAVDHLEAIERFAGAGVVDTILVNSGEIPSDRLPAYRQEGAVPIEVDREALEERGVEVVEKDLLADGPLVRHDPAKLSRAVLELVGQEDQN